MTEREFFNNLNKLSKAQLIEMLMEQWNGLEKLMENSSEDVCETCNGTGEINEKV